MKHTYSLAFIGFVTFLLNACDPPSKASDFARPTPACQTSSQTTTDAPEHPTYVPGCPWCEHGVLVDAVINELYQAASVLENCNATNTAIQTYELNASIDRMAHFLIQTKKLEAEYPSAKGYIDSTRKESGVAALKRILLATRNIEEQGYYGSSELKSAIARLNEPMEGL